MPDLSPSITTSPAWPTSRFSVEDRRVLSFYGIYSEAEAMRGNWVVLAGRAYQIVSATLSDTPATTLNRLSTGMEAEMVSAENRTLPVLYGYCHVGARIGAIAYNGQNIVLLAIWGHGPIWGVSQVLCNGAALPSNAVVRHYPGVARSATFSATITNSNRVTANAGAPFIGLSAGARIQFSGFANASNNVVLTVTNVDANKTWVEFSNALTNETATVWWKQAADAQLASLLSGYVHDLCSPAGVSPEWACAYSVVEISYGSISGFPHLSAYVYGQLTKRPDLCYVDLNGSTQYLYAANAASNQFNEDFELVACVAADDWTPAGEGAIVSKWDSSANRGWLFSLTTTGALKLYVSYDGTNYREYTSSSTLSALSNGARKWVRVRFQKTNGANSVASFATSDDGQYWTTLGSDQTAAVVATIYATTAQLRVGAFVTGYYFDGKVYAVRARSGLRIAADLQLYDAEQLATTMTDAAGIAWTFAASSAVAQHTTYTTLPVCHLADFATSASYGAGRGIDIGTALRVYDLNVQQTSAPAENLCDANHAVVEQGDVSSWIDVLRDYAHCYAILEGGRYYLIRNWDDAAVASFDSSNIIEGSFQMQTVGARNAPTEVTVAYSDRTGTPWKEGAATVYRDGVRGGTVVRRVSRVERYGTTRYSEALRAAKERLNDAYYNNSIISFTATDIGLLTRVGAPVTISFPYEAGNGSNRIAGVRYLITGMEPVGNLGGRWSITAKRHDARRFSSEVATGTPGPLNPLPSPANPPAVTIPTTATWEAGVSGLNPREHLYQLADGTWSSQIQLQWTHTAYPFVDHYWIEVYEGSVETPNLRHRGISYTTSYSIPPVKELVAHTVLVWIRSTAGVNGAAASTQVTVQGKALKPTWPSNASLTGFELGGRVFLYWPQANDIDTVRYELRAKKTSESPTWATATPPITLVDSLTYTVDGLAAGTYRFYVKAIDTVGNYTEKGGPADDGALYRDITVTTDAGNYQTLTFKPTSWCPLAATTWVGSDGKTYAATDWGDPLGYGYGEADTADLDGTVTKGTVMTQPHSQGHYFTRTQYVTIPYVAAHATGNTFSVDFWIFATDLSYNQYIFSRRGTTDPANGWAIGVGPGSGGSKRVYLSGPGAYIKESQSDVIAERRWHHIAVVQNGNNGSATTIYVDGVALTSYASSNTYTLADNTEALTIGGYDSNDTANTYLFSGFIKSVRLWDAVLTAAEVLRCGQYRGTDVTTYVNSGNLTTTYLKSSWLVNDHGEGSLNVTVLDGRSASNGTLTGISGWAKNWRSWDQVESSAIDLGSTYAGLFEIINGPTPLSGNVRTTMMLSTDGNTYLDYAGGSQRASGRYVKFRMQSEGGSAVYNLSDAAVAISLVPKEESGSTTTNSPSGGVPVPAVVALNGDYSQMTSLQLTAKVGSTTGVPLYDQVDLSFGRAMPIGRGLRFNGSTGTTGSYVNCGDYAQFEFGNGTTDSSFTIEAWFKVDALPGGYYTLMSKGDGTLAGEWILRIDSSGRVFMNVFDASAGPAWRQVYSSTTLRQGVWYHIAIVYDSATSMPNGWWDRWCMYLNGNVEPFGYNSGGGTYVAMEGTTLPLLLGNEYVAASYPAATNGILDEVRIWNGTARSQSQIQQYLQTAPPTNSTNLVGYWKLDETNGYSAADSQTYTTARNGTLGSGTQFNAQAASYPTNKWWRPPDGFDVYVRENGTSAFLGGVEVQYTFKGM